MQALFVTLLVVLLCKLVFFYKPKRSERIYDQIIAHRGLHLFAPENSLGAFAAAKGAHMGIELDVRQTRDKEIVSFHDRYTKRLLNIPGKLSMFDLATIKRHRLLDSSETVPTLVEAMSEIGKDTLVLIEPKGKMNDDYLYRLREIATEYRDNVYFHTESLAVYFKLKKHIGRLYSGEKRVFFVFDVFRKRFNFVKGKDYHSQVDKYNELASNVDIEIPSVEDISSIIVRSIETLEDKKEILAAIGEVINKYETRVSLEDKTHWVFNSLWLHRGIVTNNYLEHSKESIEACVKYARDNNMHITIEFDVMMYNGEVRCYHQDRISNIFGQSKSCAEKAKLENAISLMDVLNIVKDNPNVNLAIDIKDYHIRNRDLEYLILKDVQKSGYTGNFIVMSYNPMVLTYFKTVRPDWLRAQIGHSLKGLRKVPFFRFPWILNGVIGLLFDLSCADVVVFDNSKWIYYHIAYHKNIRGKPVLIYAPKTYVEQEAFIGRESIANFIVENVADEASWPKKYLERFKIK